ncbi:hypothetical protein D3C87_1389500 [compost metagenome]
MFWREKKFSVNCQVSCEAVIGMKPASLSLGATASNSSQVFGTATPAFSKACGLTYMIGAEELNGMPMNLPFESA